LSSFLVRIGRSNRKPKRDRQPPRIALAGASVKSLLAATLVFVGFVGGWAVEHRLALPRSPTPTELLAGTAKRCGDPRERACGPDEFSDDDLRLLCAEGLVGAQWMHERGFDTHDTADGRCELSEAEQRVLLASMSEIDPQLPSEGGAEPSPRISRNSRSIGVRVR